MAHLIDKDALSAEIERLKKEEGWCQVGKDTDVYYARGFRFACERIKDALDSLEVKEVQEEPVSEELEEVAEDYALDDYIKPWRELAKGAFKDGAKWQKEQEIKYKHRTFLQGEKSVANYILKMIDNGWHINAIYTVCKDKLKED